MSCHRVLLEERLCIRSTGATEHIGYILFACKLCAAERAAYLDDLKTKKGVLFFAGNEAAHY